MTKRFKYIIIFLCLFYVNAARSQSFFEEQNEPLVYTFSLSDVSVSGDIKPFKYSLVLDSIQPNYYILRVIFETEYPTKIPPFKVNINYPKELVDALWSSRSWSSKSYITVPNYSRLQSDYNIITALSRNSENRLTLATYDQFDAKYTSIDINYKYRYMEFTLEHFEKSYPETEVSRYVSTIVLDYRNQPYSQSIREVSDWRIRKDLKYKVPEIDFEQFPVYSLWYPLKQNIPIESVTHYMDSIVSMGFRSVLVDDGWQNVVQFSVSPTGLWKPTNASIMDELIAKSHNRNFKVGLWMSQPFLGNQGIIASKFDGKFLQYRNSSIPVLDVRYPDVRDYLMKVYVNMVKSWKVDAIDFNFLNGYYPNEEIVSSEDLGRDFILVRNALDTLKAGIYNEIKLFNPDLAVKQTYPTVGPIISSNSKTLNGFLGTNILPSIREKVANNRMMYGNKTPFMEIMGISEYDSPVDVALKFQSLLYGIPYVSFYAYTLPEETRETLNFWVKYWKSNKLSLFEQGFEALDPANHYPIMISGDDRKKIYTRYDENFDVDLGIIDFETADIINATKNQSLTLKGTIEEPLLYGVYDYKGKQIDNGYLRLRRGTQKMLVPAGGFVHLYTTEVE